MGVQATERQLHLFRSRRQRGVMPPGPSELCLHISVADLLKRWALPGILWSHLPSGEARTPQTGAKLQRMGLRRGLPDFLIFHEDGRVLALEIKSRTGRLSEDSGTSPTT